jgi:hypothetical protein
MKPKQVSMMPKSPLLHQFASAAMGLALFLVMGGHYALIQTVAWTTMLRDFSRTGSLTEAVSKTFDGEHPCPLCKKIFQAHTAEEKTSLSIKAEKKTEVFVVQKSARIPLPAYSPMIYPPSPFVLMPERREAPPLPVPRDSMS